MTPFDQTSVRAITIRRHTDRGPATTAYIARLRAVGKQIQLLLLDAILHLPAPTIPLLVQRAPRPLLDCKRRDDEPRILPPLRCSAFATTRRSHDHVSSVR